MKTDKNNKHPYKVFETEFYCMPIMKKLKINV